MTYPYRQGQGEPSLAVYGQDVDNGKRRANCELYQSPEDIARTAIVGNGGRVCEYASLRNLQRVAAEAKVQMKLDHTSEDDDYEAVGCFEMDRVEEMYVVSRRSPGGGSVDRKLRARDGKEGRTQDYVMFTTKVRLYEMVCDPQSDLQAVRLRIPVKIRHKYCPGAGVLDDIEPRYEVMHLGVLHCYQGDRVLEITHSGNDFTDPEDEQPWLVQHRVVWWMEGIIPAMKFDNPETYEWRPNAHGDVEMKRNRWVSLYVAVLNNE